jgi:alcohol dehydrogenase
MELGPGETILVHAAGSGIGSVAKPEKVRALGADHRALQAHRAQDHREGVDVVFEHVGAQTFNGSPVSLKRGLPVTGGSRSWPTATLDPMQLFHQQYRIIGPFGVSMDNIRNSTAKMASGLHAAIDSEVALADFGQALARLESRQVSGKIIVRP